MEGKAEKQTKKDETKVATKHSKRFQVNRFILLWSNGWGALFAPSLYAKCFFRHFLNQRLKAGGVEA